MQSGRAVGTGNKHLMLNNPMLTPDSGSTFTLLPERGWHEQGWAWAQYTSCALLGSSCFLSQATGAFTSLIDYLDSSRSHALSCINIHNATAPVDFSV